MTSEIEAENNPNIEVREKSKLGYAIELLVAYKLYIVIAGLGAVVASQFGWFSLPTLSIGQLFVVVAVPIGLLGGWVVSTRVEPYVREDRVLVDIIPFGTEVSDRIRVPRRVWRDLDFVGGEPPTRRTLSGRRVYGVRAIDFDRGELFPADDFPDDPSVPNYWDILAEGADKASVKYREYLLDYAQKYSEMNVEDEVIREDARAEAVMMYAKGLADGRNGEIDIERKPDEEDITDAEQVIEKMARMDASDGGDADE